jgi:hypothetical protein
MNKKEDKRRREWVEKREERRGMHKESGAKGVESE